MYLRFNTLLNQSILPLAKSCLAFMLLLLLVQSPLKAQQTMDDTKKQANKLYEDDEFTEAYKYYAQLVANFPKDPEFNYRLGVCMIYSEADKKKCLPYLKQAAANASEAPKDVYFYLGKAYHINYQFDDAIKNYNEFKKTASQSQQKKLQVEREISACNNGKRLLSHLTDLEIKSKKQLNEADYFRTYDLKTIGGKLLVKPEEFRSAIDKKKKEKSIIYLPKNSNIVFYSSYGLSPETGKDIYVVTKTENGFGQPQKVKGINTEFDEDFPFLHPNGKTLYFSSKGFNSMGGYDIFKSTLNESDNSWSTPENLQFPINSPDDDFLYVTDSLEQNASFSTGRQSPPGKIDVLKINTERIPIDILAIAGTVKKENETQGVASFITIKNLETNVTLGVISANDLGNYKMELPNGGKILYSVETPGVKTQTAEVALPLAEQSKPYKQEITYEKGRLNIINHFDESNDEENNYLQYIDVIEKKAKLEVTPASKKTIKRPEIIAVIEDSLIKGSVSKTPEITKEAQVAVTPTISASSNTSSSTEDNSKEATNNENTVDTNEPISNNETKEPIAVKEEEKAPENTNKLEPKTETTSNAANTSANKKPIAPKTYEGVTPEMDPTQIANIALKDANEDLQEANQFERDSKTLMANGQTMLAEAVANIKAANTQLASSKSIADAKKKEETISNAESKKETAQKDSVSAQEILKYAAGLNVEAAAKRKEAQLSKQYAQDLLNEHNGENIEAPIASAEEKVVKTKPAVKNKTNAKATKPTTNPKETDNVTETASETNNVTSNESSSSLNEKYANKIVQGNNLEKQQVVQNNMTLSHFNLEIDEAIKSNKAQLTKTKDPEKKKLINSEIASLQQLKSDNTAQINDNKEQLASLSNTNNNGLSQIEASNATEAIEKIEDLKNQIINNDNENFDFNAYQNPQAQSLKVEADSRINDAIARQKKLKTELDQAVEELKATSGLSTAKSDIALTAEADSYHEKALRIENNAKGKQGAEKTKLLAEAKKMDEKANQTYLEAADQTAIKNQKEFNLSQDNISNIIKENKSSEADIAQSQKLQEEANTAFKQAQAIRSEAASNANVSVKLAGYYNAEEKEVEANKKQQEALDILKKANPDFVLKTSASASDANNQSPEGKVQEKLNAVNQSINEVADIKIDAYQKLALANETEVDTLSEKVSENIEMIDKYPKLKSDMISANNKLQASKKLKTQADAEKDKSKKVNLMIASIKKQNEALKQLNDVSNAMNPNGVQPVAQTSVTSENNTPKEPPVTETNSEQNNSNETTKAEQATEENDNNPVTTKTTQKTEPEKNQEAEVQTEPETKSETNNSNESAAVNNTMDINAIINSPEIKADTSATQMVQYLNAKTIELKNPAANKMFTASLEQLKQYDTDLSNLEKSSNSAPIKVDLDLAQELKNKSETLTRDGDNLTIQSIETRKEAQGKEGAEKDDIIAKANQQENEALDKNIEASELILQSNEIEAQNNSNMLQVYLAKVKTDNPDLYNELDAKNAELKTLNNQVKNLKAEASSMPSKGAKFGALSNAQEKEIELVQKQNELVSQLKAKYPDFVYNPADAPIQSNVASPDTEQKRKTIVIKQQDELTKLTNALRLEFETKKYAVPLKLNAEQTQTRDLIMRLNAESKRLLVQSAQQKDENIKTKNLSLAAKYASEALIELNKIIPEGTVAKNTAPPATNNPKPVTNKPVKEEATQTEKSNQTEETTNEVVVEKPKVAKPKPTKTKKPKPPVEEPVATTEPEPEAEAPIKVNPPKENISVLRVEGLEIKTVNAYSETKPIPVDAKVEDGLIFRVQIGAFRNKLPNSAFKGLSPVNAETTPAGFLRYTAGNFNKFELANAVKNDLRSLGYSDAFVVGFYNGKRIGLSEAIDILTKEGKMIDRNAMQTAGISENTNLPRANVNPAIAANLVVSKSIEKVNGLLYTVQIGVYNRQVTKTQLFNLRPIFSEELPSGLFRYTAGIYNNVDRLVKDKLKVNNLGLRDAFVTAYLNGKRIGYGDAKDKQANDSTVKMETEEPIIFSDVTEANTNPNPAPTVAQTIAAPFSNGVKSYPAATPQNGIKANEDGACFKVQIGAYSKKVPNEVAAKYNAIKNWPIEGKLINSLYIYNIGNFSNAKFAKALKDEAIKLGLSDAFITVYQNGSKVYGTDAANLLNQ